MLKAIVLVILHTQVPHYMVIYPTRTLLLRLRTLRLQLFYPMQHSFLSLAVSFVVLALLLFEYQGFMPLYRPNFNAPRLESIYCVSAAYISHESLCRTSLVQPGFSSTATALSICHQHVSNLFHHPKPSVFVLMH